MWYGDGRAYHRYHVELRKGEDRPQSHDRPQAIRGAAIPQEAKDPHLFANLRPQLPEAGLQTVRVDLQRQNRGTAEA